jgi:hypothetical protein
VEAKVIALYAGVVAERRLTGRRHNWGGAASDLGSAHDWILVKAGSTRQAQKLSEYRGS